jgi:cell division transport system permease protein
MLKHSLVEGLKNVVRSFWLSATAISVLTVSLGSVALMATVSTVVGFSLRRLDSQVSLNAYFKDDVEQSAIQTLQNDLQSRSEVKSVRFVSKDDAKNELQDSTNVSNSLIKTLQTANVDLFQNNLEIIPANSESYSKITDILQSDKYKNIIDDIRGSQQFVDNLQKIYSWTNIIGLILVTIYALVSILVMANILRIAIYSHRDEIEIMRLVGATNGYIRGPFIAEGAYFNIFAAVIIIALYIPAVSLIVPLLNRFLSIGVDAGSGNLIIQMYLSVTATVFAGIAVGIVTAYIATQRYLKL